MKLSSSTRVFLTAHESHHRLAEQAPLTPASREQIADLHVVTVNPDRTFQTIEGFGGAFTDAAAVTWQKLSARKREQVLREYFSADNGHAYRLSPQ